MARKTLTHDEVLRLRTETTFDQSVSDILSTFDRATPSDVEAGTRWYDEAGEIAASLPGVTFEQGCAIIAHLSPRTPWARNVAGAIHFVTHNDRMEGILDANYQRALSSLEFADPSASFNGPKTARFYWNILGIRDVVTIDVWAARVVGVTEKQLSRVGVYDALEAAYQDAARQRGVDPATMQASCWVVQRNGRAA